MASRGRGLAGLSRSLPAPAENNHKEATMETDDTPTVSEDFKIGFRNAIIISVIFWCFVILAISWMMIR